MRRVLAAPNAWRTAISRPRALARASSRLATLTQLISRTRPTAPNSRMSDWRTLPTRVSARGVRWIVHAAWRRIIRRILLLQRCNQGIEAPLRGLRRETRLEGARWSRRGNACRASAAERGRRQIRRRPQIGTALVAGLALVAKAGGHDADNMIDIVVQAQTLAENVRVGAKCALPEPIADDDFRDEAGCGVVRIPGAAQLRVDAEHREVAR